MPSMPTILLVLSFPAGVIAYTVAAQILMSLLPADGSREFIVLIVPLFVAGLVMVPFLIPFFDQRAKEDLAAYLRSQGKDATVDGDPPDAEER
jgi:hypothetical protein